MKTSAPLFSIAALFLLAAAGPLSGQYMSEKYDHSSASSKALAMEQARADTLAKRGKTAAYTKHFDLSGLPHYTAKEQISGKFRVWGNQYLGISNLADYWGAGFKKVQPGVTVEFFTPVSGVTWPGLYLGLADVGMCADPGFYDLQAYERVMHFHPTGVTCITGSYNVMGWSNATVISVNTANPLTKITFRQLDGIFGSLRDGGWSGTYWDPNRKRGTDGDIRTWGQMGLTGDWADKKINAYGFSIRYNTATTFSDKVLQGSDKWNGELHTFANYLRPDGSFFVEADQMMDKLSEDPYGIAYNHYHEDRPKLRSLEVSEADSGPYVPLTIDTVQNRTYPLYWDMSFWTNVKPGERMKPNVREFLRYILSQEGQEEVQRDGKYLPLTAAVVHEQLKKVR